MTQEEKAKAYDESLERAKKLYEQGTITESLSYVFPELKESEDERIRKALAEMVHDTTGDTLSDYGINKGDALSWLEKQKTTEEALQYLKENHSPSEMSDFQAAMNISVAKAYNKGYADGLEKQGEFYTKRDVDNAYIEGMAFAKDELEKQNKQILANSAKTCKDEQQPTDNDMKELLHTEYEKGRADAIAEIQKPVDCIDCTNSKGCINCKDGNMKETLVRKPAWSEEDECYMSECIGAIATKDGWSFEEKRKTKHWLESLKGRVQPKQEWSKEDESIALGIEQIVNCASLLNVAPDRLNKVRDWLKSLKQRIGG